VTCTRGDAVWDWDGARGCRCGRVVRQLLQQGANAVLLPDPYNELSPVGQSQPHPESDVTILQLSGSNEMAVVRDVEVTQHLGLAPALLVLKLVQQKLMKS